MKTIFLESHNLKNPYFGFGQFNLQLLKAFKNPPTDLKLIVHSHNISKDKKRFGKNLGYKQYFSFRRYENLRIRKKYDLWHSLNQNIKIEPYHQIPYLLTVHNTVYPEQPNHKNHVRMQEKLFRSQAITYISEFAKSSTNEYFEVPDVPQYVVYNGNPITELTIGPNFLPEVVPERPFLFFIGEFAVRKNLKCLVEMMRLLPNYDLVLAGKNKTKYGEEIRQLIEKYKMEKRVHLVGKIPDTEKQYYYKNCTAFVFPSLREGFGLPLIEAMYFEKPIFSSATTSLPEIGQNLVFYWENYNPEYMKSIFEEGLNTYFRKKEFYRKALKERALYFSWDKAAKEYLKIYQSLV